MPEIMYFPVLACLLRFFDCIFTQISKKNPRMLSLRFLKVFKALLPEFFLSFLGFLSFFFRHLEKSRPWVAFQTPHITDICGQSKCWIPVFPPPIDSPSITLRCFWRPSPHEFYSFFCECTTPLSQSPRHKPFLCRWCAGHTERITTLMVPILMRKYGEHCVKVNDR